VFSPWFDTDTVPSDQNREDQMEQFLIRPPRTRRSLALSCLVWVIASIAPPALFATVAHAQAQLSNNVDKLGVMTYNVYEGTDFTQLADAENLSQLLIAVGQTITQGAPGACRIPATWVHSSVA
jgi:hypothetical protein